ncbi:MAG: hypothetical protein ACK5X3_00625 [Pseudomonadota bacterium]
MTTEDYGSVEAQEARKALVAEWEADENQTVRDLAARFIRSADNRLADGAAARRPNRCAAQDRVRRFVSGPPSGQNLTFGARV